MNQLLPSMHMLVFSPMQVEDSSSTLGVGLATGLPHVGKDEKSLKPLLTYLLSDFSSTKTTSSYSQIVNF